MISTVIIRLNPVEVVIGRAVGDLPFRHFRLVASQCDDSFRCRLRCPLCLHRFNQLIVFIVAVLFHGRCAIEDLGLLRHAVDRVVHIGVRAECSGSQLGQLG